MDEKNKSMAIITTMLNEVARFGGPVLILTTRLERSHEDYRRLYRLYRAALKALTSLETERADLENELQPLPSHADSVLQSSGINVKLWSQYFYKNPTPTKMRHTKTVPSPATEHIGSLLHSIGSFIGLTAEAVCSSKRNEDNITKIKHLLLVTEETIKCLKMHRDKIVKVLEPFMEEQRDTENMNSGTISGSSFCSDPGE
ncbi:hypothetical protein HA402_000219 [Bradysia odoriphaga]|nr:hypothetical protein HA402_000219 [Bradysia odoriphaga]